MHLIMIICSFLISTESNGKGLIFESRDQQFNLSLEPYTDQKYFLTFEGRINNNKLNVNKTIYITKKVENEYRPHLFNLFKLTLKSKSKAVFFHNKDKVPIELTLVDKKNINLKNKFEHLMKKFNFKPWELSEKIKANCHKKISTNLSPRPLQQNMMLSGLIRFCNKGKSEREWVQRLGNLNFFAQRDGPQEPNVKYNKEFNSFTVINSNQYLNADEYFFQLLSKIYSRQ